MPMGELTEKERGEFREIFNLVDSDGTGKITAQELRKLFDMLHLRPTEEELDEMFNEGSRGRDTSSGIDFEQFVSVMSKRVQSDYTPEQLRSAFKIFETDDLPPNYVSTEVLEHALVTYGSEKLSRDEAARLLAAVDPEGTGKINYHDFVALVSGK